MNMFGKIAIVTVLIAAVGAVVVVKNGGSTSCCPPGAAVTDMHQPPGESAQSPLPDQTEDKLPRLVELGSTTCRPCQAMKPILDELTAEYAGRLSVEFIDVRVAVSEAEAFNLRVIPTQVFLDAQGSELFRHEGFFAKEDILAKWKELGYVFSKTQ